MPTFVGEQTGSNRWSRISHTVNGLRNSISQEMIDPVLVRTIGKNGRAFEIAHSNGYADKGNL